MAVHYVGGEPTRITCYTQRKSTERWMSRPKASMRLPSLGDILYVTTTIVSGIVVIAFILVCFR